MTPVERLDRLTAVWRLPEKRRRLVQLEEQAAAPNLWEDRERAAAITREIAELKALIQRLETVRELAAETGETAAKLVEEELGSLERLALLAGPYDQRPAILTLYAGAGGTDAQDWAEMLLRLYQRYVERGRVESPGLISRANWHSELLELSRGEEAGLKSATLLVSGTMAYGLLKAEAGVHRLVRQSPYNAKALRQTSFALVDVVPELDEPEVKIDDKDLRVDVFRSSGPGGQSVNTTDSAVRLTHLPTGLTATVQDEKSQHKNRAKALTILLSRLAAVERARQNQETAAVRGSFKEIEWGSQIRSYVLHPYKQIKDHRTGVTVNGEQAIQEVLDGDLDRFITAELERQLTTNHG